MIFDYNNRDLVNQYLRDLPENGGSSSVIRDAKQSAMGKSIWDVATCYYNGGGDAKALEEMLTPSSVEKKDKYSIPFTVNNPHGGCVVVLPRGYQVTLVAFTDNPNEEGMKGWCVTDITGPDGEKYATIEQLCKKKRLELYSYNKRRGGKSFLLC